jgi:hypothetical protein
MPEEGRPVNLYSAVGSVLLHFAVFFGLIFIMRIAESGSGGSYGGYYVDMYSPKGAPGGGNSNPEDQRAVENKAEDRSKDIAEDKKKESLPGIKQEKSAEKEILRTGKYVEKKDPGEKPVHQASGEGSGTGSVRGAGPAGGYYNMNSGGFDSTGLGQVYQEPTLKVRLNYPSGWIYLDQQRKRKLDGITFWASLGDYYPPPYIHVEVVEKYVFNPDQYKYKYDFDLFTGYYNDPEEMENQVSQTIYIRTSDDEDYSIKLIMQGREAFKEFQPVFFAMVKSFRFGNSIF